MTSRIDIIGQNGGTGDHYMLEDLKKFAKLYSEYESLIWEASEKYCLEEDVDLVRWNWTDTGIDIEYCYEPACDCCSYEFGTESLTFEEIVSYIENTNTNK